MADENNVELKFVYRSSMPGGGVFELRLEREPTARDMKHIHQYIELLEGGLPQETRTTKHAAVAFVATPKTPVETALRALHGAWSAAVHKPGYDKNAWKVSYDQAIAEKWDAVRVDQAIAENSKSAP